MKHAAHSVDILDQHGTIIGTKQRQDINKTTDMYHTVYCLLITPEGRLLLTQIPERSDLPNLYAKRLGFPGATIRRTNEDSMTAAKRLSAREFFITNAEFHFVGDMTLEDTSKKFISLFYLITEPLLDYNKTDLDGLIELTTKEIGEKFRTTSNEFAPSFTEVWQKWRHLLPT